MHFEYKKLSQCLKWLDQKDITYVVVGSNVDTFIDEITSDIDVIVKPTTINKIHTIINDLCNEYDLLCVQILQHERRAFYFVLTWYEDNQYKYLKLDFCDHYVRNAKLLMDANELLESRIKHSKLDLYVPTNEKNILYYLLKKIDKGFINQQQFNFIRNKLLDCEELFNKELLKFWSEEDAQNIINELRLNDMAKFVDNIAKYQKDLRSKLYFSFNDLFREIQRIYKRIIKPTGLSIAIYGPDGSGKSSVINLLNQRVCNVFRNVSEYHFRPHLFSRDDRKDIEVIDPHKHKPRNPIMSLFKILYYCLDYILGYLIIIYPKKIRSSLIIFDRYYDDLLVDNKRYRYNNPKWVLKCIRPLIPMPNIIFCLDADPHILQSRKNEVSFNECRRQRELYKKMIKNYSNGFIIDASKSISEVANDIERIILEYQCNQLYKKKLFKLRR